jgi:hypothetical protein
MQQPWRWHSSELTCLNPFPSGADTGHRVRPTLPALSAPPKEGDLPREGEFDFLAEAETAFAPHNRRMQSEAQSGNSDAGKAALKPALKKTAARKKATS